MNKIKKYKGVTLVELLIVLAIFGIVLTCIFAFFIFNNKSFSIGENQSEAQYNVRLASESITRELRVADTIEILDGIPDTFDVYKKYIFIDDNSIKLYMGGYEKVILKGTSNFTPVLTFNKKAGNDKVLNFVIDGIKGSQNYKIDSDIYILNMEDKNSILGKSSGSVVTFGPFTNPEIVQVDKLLLNLLTLNNHLTIDAANAYVLPSPPVIDYIKLQDKGDNGSNITWSSSNVSVIRTDGTIIRPGIDKGDVTVILTATLTMGLESDSKIFTVTVKDMDQVNIGNLTLPNGTIGVVYNHSFDAIGGNGIYTFTEYDLGNGLKLDSGGNIVGTPTKGGIINFNVTLKDSLGNSDTKNVSLTVTP